MGRTPNETPTDTLSLLVVGSMSDWTNSGKALPQDKDIRFCDFANLTAEILTQAKPKLVLSQLFSPGFDALDLAHLLCDLGYVGRYIALTVPLDHPDLIKDEVERTCPNLDFDIIEIGQTKDVRAL